MMISLKARKGITPVIAIVMLLMMTIAATGGAWFWIQNIQGRFKQKTMERMGKEFTFKGMTCKNDELSVTVANTGDKTIDVTPINLYIYDYSTGKLNNTLSKSGINSFSGADFVEPGSFDSKDISLDANLQPGKTYTIEIEFPQDTLNSIERECKAS